MNDQKRKGSWCVTVTMTELMRKRVPFPGSQTSVGGVHLLVDIKTKKVERKSDKEPPTQFDKYLWEMQYKNTTAMTTEKGRLVSQVYDKAGGWREMRHCLKRGQREGEMMKTKLCQS